MLGGVKGRGGARLAAEAFEELAVLGQLLGRELDCHAAAQLGVFGLVDHTHPTTPELFNDAIVGNRLANHGRMAQE
jgi:hypothetical protein